MVADDPKPKVVRAAPASASSTRLLPKELIVVLAGRTNVLMFASTSASGRALSALVPCAAVAYALEAVVADDPKPKVPRATPASASPTKSLPKELIVVLAGRTNVLMSASTSASGRALSAVVVVVVRTASLAATSTPSNVLFVVIGPVIAPPVVGSALSALTPCAVVAALAMTFVPSQDTSAEVPAVIACPVPPEVFTVIVWLVLLLTTYVFDLVGQMMFTAPPGVPVKFSIAGRDWSVAPSLVPNVTSLVLVSAIETRPAIACSIIEVI